MTMQYYYSLLLVTTHTRLVVPKACIIPSDGTRLFDNSKYVKFYLSLNLNLIPAKSKFSKLLVTAAGQRRLFVPFFVSGLVFCLEWLNILRRLQ